MTNAILGAVAGGAYAGALWLVAARIARRRGLGLGDCPWWLLAGCAGVATVLPAALPGDRVVAMGFALIGALVCGIVDARTGFIFDALSLGVTLPAATAALLCGRLAEGGLGVALAGGCLGGLYLLTGRRSIGLGDVKLGAALGIGYGAGSALLAIGSAFVLGALYAIALLWRGRLQRSDAVRFGPFLAAGATVAAVAGDPARWM
jgi:leader peptidase (prepilin peptidase)/N-methyltransferase